jgi:hypothetical protein
MEQFEVPARLRMTIGRCAETFVAASGMLTLLIIVLAMAMMMRGIRLLHR